MKRFNLNTGQPEGEHWDWWYFTMGMSIGVLLGIMIVVILT